MQDRKYLPDPGRKRTWWIQCKQVKGSHLTRSTHLLGPTYSCGTKPPCCTLQVFRNYEVICVTCQAHGFSGGVNKLTMQLKDFANAKSYAREDPLLAGQPSCWRARDAMGQTNQRAHIIQNQSNFFCLFSSSAYFTFLYGGFVNVTSEQLTVYCKGKIILEA